MKPNTTDAQIREFFHAQKPVFNDGTNYMAKLQKKIDEVNSNVAIAEIRKMHSAQVKRYRNIIITTFFIGLMVGAFCAIYLIINPIRLPQINDDIINSIVLFVTEQKYVLILIMVGIVVALRPILIEKLDYDLPKLF